ncbi:helix-turn-helix domain-containing protein [Streptomyces sp. LE64]|uniref:helix-turn-helix domain-containing protein n=1 Tax=Streptomyces sp. LE64 TaxID=3448653 RepID=UPI004042D768
MLQYVAALRDLRDWSGLTYRQLAAKAQAADEVLPTSTLASALRRDTLPRPELVASLVRAVGLDEAAVACWLRARQRVQEAAAETVQAEEADKAAPAVDDDGEGNGAPAVDGPGRRAGARRRALKVSIAGAVALAVPLAIGTALKLSEDRDDTPSTASLPSAGWYQMRPQHVLGRGLCIGEGRERNGRTKRPLAVQRPCRSVEPSTYLERVSEGVYQIQWHHPEHGVGCLTVDLAYRVPGALVAPVDCKGSAHQRFAVEPARPGRGNVYRLRPLHSSLCLGSLGGEVDTDNGAELSQKNCDGGEDQEFSFEPSQPPSPGS